MVWASMLAYITGTVDQELLLRNEYLAAENRVLKSQIKGRLLLSDGEKATLAEIAYRLGRKALREVAMVAQPETILASYRRVIANKFDGSRSRRCPGRPRVGDGADRPESAAAGDARPCPRPPAGRPDAQALGAARRAREHDQALRREWDRFLRRRTIYEKRRIRNDRP